MNLDTIRKSFSADRRFHRDVLWNVGSLGVLMLCGIAINALIVRYRDTATLGVFNQVYAIYIVLSQFGVGGVHLSALKHISHNHDDRATCGLIGTAALLTAAVLAVIVSAAAYLTRDLAGQLLDSPGVTTGVALAAPGLLFFSLNKVLLAIVNGMRHMRAFAVFNALRFLLIIATVIVILVRRYPGEYLAVSLTVSEVVLFVVLIVYVNVAVVPLRAARGVGVWCRQHLSFGARGFLSGALSEVNTRVDVLMLGYFCTDRIVGVYSFAAMFVEAIAQLPLVVRRNMDPLLGKHFAAGTLDELLPFARRMKWLVYGVMAGVAVLATAGFPLAVYLFKPDAALSTLWVVFAVLMLGNLLNSGYRVFWGVLLQGGRPAMHTLLVFLVVVSNTILNAALIPLLGVYGAACATAGVCVLEAFLVHLFARKLFRIRL